MHIPTVRGAARAAAVATLSFVLAASTLAQQAVTAPPPTGPAAPPAAVDAQGNALPQRGIAETERVFVTGSAIPTAAEVGPNPVLTATREAIEKSGQRTAEQFLQALPVVNANSIPVSNNNNGSDTAIGAAGIALRGFDARATLVLIDGRRVAPYPITNSGIAFVD
ncbi:MAG TPA: Plug domain-containing protein, partial [Chthoniobacterales bacterium]|nr:Plug domain-containing protein [Chthoniobacterales bacterium]